MGFKNRPTIRDHISDGILRKFLNQLPWQKDCLLKDEYKDIVKLDKIADNKIQLHDGTISVKFFTEMLHDMPRFEFDKHNYDFRVGNFTRETIPVTKYIPKWPQFHIKKLLPKEMTS